MTFSQNVKKRWIFFVMWIILWGIWGYCFFYFQNLYFHQENTTKSSHTTQQGDKKESLVFSGTLSYDVFSSPKVQKAYSYVEKNYYAFHKKSKKQIEGDFIDALLKSLGDKHSTYFDEEMSEVFQEDLRGDFEGIGAVVSPDAKGIKITHILETSPAQKAGLKAWDIVTHVDGDGIAGLTVSEAIEKIRWPKGTTIELTYLRGEQGNKKTDITPVTRDVVKIPSVTAKMLENNIGYIKVSTFGEDTSRDFYQEFNTLVGSGSQAVVLDFRYNGGGYLTTAIDLSSAFLPKNTPVVKIKENDPTKNEILYTKSGTEPNENIPIVVLINNYSASASEIFAGALQSHKRALILGEQSYGKWSAQELYDLGDGTLIKLTTAKWYTPDDVSIDEKGITPDTFVYITDEDYENTYDRQLEAAQKILKHIKDTGDNNYESIKTFAADTNFQE